MSARRPSLGQRSRNRVPADKRRLILDAAVRVFARQGFHACRVSDIADEAGVAYGLVYHYFASKDEVLDTLFLERWGVMLELIRDVDAQQLPVRAKFGAHPANQHSGGRSMIVDPWGVVLAQAADGEGYVIADLDLERQRQIRDSLPSLANRRPSAYHPPHQVPA